MPLSFIKNIDVCLSVRARLPTSNNPFNSLKTKLNPILHFSIPEAASLGCRLLHNKEKPALLPCQTNFKSNSHIKYGSYGGGWISLKLMCYIASHDIKPVVFGD